MNRDLYAYMYAYRYGVVYVLILPRKNECSFTI